MFNKSSFAQIIKNIKDTYDSQEEFSKKSGIGRTYLSQYMNMKLDKPPKPEILEKLASSSKNIVSYEELMKICGYLGNIRGNRLKSCRLSKNLSLAEVAEKVGTTPRKLKLWEDGHDYNADIDTLVKLADFYNTTFTWLNYGHLYTSTEKQNILSSIEDLYGSSSVKLLENYNKLNELGKQTADIYIEDLTRIEKYTEKKQDHEANG